MGHQSRAKALNAVGWIDTSIRGLGGERRFQDGLWLREPGAPAVYPAAVTFGSATTDAIVSPLADALASWGPAPFFLWDVGGTHDLAPVGLHHVWTHPWYVREPSPFVAPESGIEFLRARDVASLDAFERAARVGNEAEGDAERWHAVATLSDERVSYLLGRLNDRAVVSGVTFDSADMVGLYEVSTPPPLRRRGHARALVHHVVVTHDGRRLGVWPDPPSVPIYTDAGFVVGGHIALWIRA